MIASELISSSVLPLKITDAFSVALDFLQDQKLNELPVIDGDSFLGLISENDLIIPEPEPHILSNISDRFNKISILPHIHLFEVLESFIKHNISILPVVDENSVYLGSILKNEMAEITGKLFSADSPGGIIEIEIRENDYMLSEIARIIEYNDAKILSSFVIMHPDSNLLEITIKINKIDIEAILQTFDRYNYNVIRSFSGNETKGLVIERFESLMKYLQI